MGERIVSGDASEFRIEANKEAIFRFDFQRSQIAWSRVPPELAHQIRHEACHKFTLSGKKPNNR